MEHEKVWLSIETPPAAQQTWLKLITSSKPHPSPAGTLVTRNQRKNSAETNYFRSLKPSNTVLVLKQVRGPLLPAQTWQMKPKEHFSRN